MTTGKKIITERALMARLRRVLAREGDKVGYSLPTRYWIVLDGAYTEGHTREKFEFWCRHYGVLASYEALEQEATA